MEKIIEDFDQKSMDSFIIPEKHYSFQPVWFQPNSYILKNRFYSLYKNSQSK